MILDFKMVIFKESALIRPLAYIYYINQYIYIVTLTQKRNKRIFQKALYAESLIDHKKVCNVRLPTTLRDGQRVVQMWHFLYSYVFGFEMECVDYCTV